MNVSNLTTMGPVTTSPAQVSSVLGTGKPATQGNSLPASGQVIAQSGSPQGEGGASQPDLNAEELKNLVDQINGDLPVRFSNLKFSVAEGTNINVVRVEDSKTGELIRQIPAEAMVALARALDEINQGMMLKEKV